MYKNDIEQLIRNRISTRTYDDRVISDEIRTDLLHYMKGLDNDMYRFDIVDYQIEDGSKLTTYGLIRNAKTFIVAIGKSSLVTDKENAIQFGYDFEKIILKATDLNLKTCWMGLSYKEERLRTMVKAKADERIVMASPIGYSKGRHIIEKLTRLSIKAHKRNDFEKIFTDKDFVQPLTHLIDEKYRIVLDMLRLAPSAGNSQPWRVVQTEEGFDFYGQGKKFYDNMKDKKIDFTYNDMGIAKLHFELTAHKYDLKGEWYIKEHHILKDLEYMFSYR